VTLVFWASTFMPSSPILTEVPFWVCGAGGGVAGGVAEGPAGGAIGTGGGTGTSFLQDRHKAIDNRVDASNSFFMVLVFRY